MNKEAYTYCKEPAVDTLYLMRVYTDRQAQRLNCVGQVIRGSGKARQKKKKRFCSTLSNEDKQFFSPVRTDVIGQGSSGVKGSDILSEGEGSQSRL
jgi:hypothetical protein